MAVELNLDASVKVNTPEDLSLLNDDDVDDDDEFLNDISNEYCFNDNEDFLDGLKEFNLEEIHVDNLSMVEGARQPSIPGSANVTGKCDSKIGLLSVDERGKENVYSDEVKAMMKKITEGIENKIQEEMKNELKSKTNGLGAVDNEIDTSVFNKNVFNEEDQDPKLLEAMIKLDRLDRILEKKIKIEKEVKRRRMNLEKRMRQEIAKLASGVNVNKEILMNAEKFLALEPPAHHNEGVTLNDEDDDDEIEDLPPVFQTQINEDEVMRGQENQPFSPVNEEIGANRNDSKAKKSSGSSESQFSFKTKGNKHKTDFIKRNKELAANADEAVAMTDDEKKRLAELLEGLDGLSDPEESSNEGSKGHLDSYQLEVHPGEGFCPDQSEMKSLATIHDKLKALMCDEDYQSIVQPSNAPSSPVVPLFDRVGIQTQVIGSDLPGRYREKVLIQAKDDRDIKARLQSIEQELEKFNSPNENESSEECHLTNEQLERLLDQCAKSLCPEEDNSDLSARSTASSRLLLLENPPKLTEDQLQKLLSEAHFPMSSRIQSQRDYYSKLLEGENSVETIRAETWKTIRDVDLDEHAISCVQSSSMNNTDQDADIKLDLADNAYLNISNNHNSSDISDTSNNGQGDGQEKPSNFRLATPPERFSALDIFQPSHYSGPIASSLQGSSGCLPRMFQSNGVSRSESYLDTYISGGNTAPLSIETAVDAIKLPNISTKSFLVHAQQGINNTKEKAKICASRKDQLQISSSGLSDIKDDNASGDKEASKGQGNGCNSSGRKLSNYQSKPHKNRQSKDH